MKKWINNDSMNISNLGDNSVNKASHGEWKFKINSNKAHKYWQDRNL